MSRCLSVASLNPTSNGLLKLLTDFLMQCCMRSSFSSVKKGRWHPNKILVSCQCVLSQPEGCCKIRLSSLKDPGHDLGVWVAFVFSWRLAWAVAVVLAVWQVVIPGSDVSFVSANHDANIKLSKNQKTIFDNLLRISVCKHFNRNRG